ncbi:MAG: adenylyl-sulfate kinase [Acidimicrobiia bacterium]|nr:adenylyl-sulfate kinase [Acidimicrobiia bacterium]
MSEPPRSPDVVWHEEGVPRAERWATSGLTGATVWLTGLSGSGKSTAASALTRVLVSRGVATYTLDGDNLRHGLNGDLGFSAADRTENVRRVAEVARLFADAGIVAVVPLISPYRAGREHARRLHDAAGLPFLEVFVDVPLEVCEARDPKGLYAKARAGDLPGFTGIDDPYEPPEHPDLVVAADRETPEAAAERIAAWVGSAVSAGG